MRLVGTAHSPPNFIFNNAQLLTSVTGDSFNSYIIYELKEFDTKLWDLRLDKGAYVLDADGNVYLDCLAAASCNILGYGWAEIANNYHQVATKIQHSCFPYSPSLQAVELAEKLIQITPGDYEKRVLLGLSGSDACDGAIEAVRKYTHKFDLIKFHND
jgi:4-aminobutyrate aminotransferase-like enzyme